MICVNKSFDLFQVICQRTELYLRMNEIELGVIDHVLIFLLGVVLPTLAVLQSQDGLKGIVFDTPMKKQIYYGNGIFQWICASAILLSWWWYSRSYETIGFQIGTWTNLSINLLLGVIFLYVLDVWLELRNPEKRAETKKKWLNDVPILPVNFEEFKHFLFVAFTAGVCEEIIFRGFFINYFLSMNEDNTLGNCLSIIIPAFLFAVGHIYQGEKAVAKTMLMALLFGWIYFLTKSLLFLILIHFLIDVIGGYLAYRILQTPKSNTFTE